MIGGNGSSVKQAAKRERGRGRKKEGRKEEREKEKEKERIARGECCFPVEKGRVTVVAVARLVKGRTKGERGAQDRAN